LSERYRRLFIPSAERPAPEKIVSLPLEVKFKALMLTTLGMRYPQHRAAFFPLARKLNYERSFPYHFLKDILDDILP